MGDAGQGIERRYNLFNLLEKRERDEKKKGLPATPNRLSAAPELASRMKYAALQNPSSHLL